MSCRICKSTGITKFRFGDISLLKCSKCDIIYLESFPDENSLESLYSDNYKISTKNSDTELRRTVQQIENYAIMNLINKYRSDAYSLVDIGCDRGFFIDEARRNNFEVFGVELNKEAQHYCKKIGLNVKSDIAEFSMVFDVITMNHSLEHFPNPDIYLSNLKSHLINNGLVIIRVPAFDSFFAKLLKNKWIWFQPENHYFHFSIQSIKFILEKNNYEILEISRRNPSKVLHYFKYLLSRIEFSKNGLIPFQLKILLSQIIKNLTATEILVVARNK